MSKADHAAYAKFAAAWFIALVAFWAWWLTPEHMTDPLRFWVNTAMIAWATIVPGYFVQLLSHSCTPDPERAPPRSWRVAMVVTKAPSEPFEVVRRTLEAMLSQDWPHDTWLADEAPSDETLAWCAANGVRVSTRNGVAAYHRPVWPRRTRCKEGNLAYFYDTYGYANYDFVVQLDADHVPGPNYLIEMIRPFQDPEVGYVSAPSICDSNARESWSARGRLHVEGGLHGALQASYNSGLAPLCIGSHYAVRTRALKQIGGLGPELAEDHSTTLIMNAHGWRGVHALDAIAHGEGPPTFEDLATQEFQWSRSLAIILVRYTGRYWSGLSTKLKAQFLFSQLWYPLFSLFMAGLVLLPAIALLTHSSWVRVAYPDFIVRSTALMAPLIALMLWVKSRGWFRPVDAKVLSWEGVIFTFARWPWSLMGMLIGAYDGLARREFAFRVTPKGGTGAASAPLAVVLPYVGLSLACALPVVLIAHPGTASGFYVFSLLNAMIYLAIAVVIVVMHARERPRRERGRRRLAPGLFLAWAAPAAVAAGVLIAAAWLRLPAGASALIAGVDGTSIVTVAGADPETAIATGWARLLAWLRTPHPPLGFGVYDPGRQLSASPAVGIDHVFVPWNAPNAAAQIRTAARSAAAGKHALLLTVEPWADAGSDPRHLLSDVSDGRYDRKIASVCGALSGTQSPVFLRWGHEMDLPAQRYPWQTQNARQYTDAYRRFVARCRVDSNGAQAVRFVWSPSGEKSLSAYYPGARYVDWIGLSLYECTHCRPGATSVPAAVPGLLQSKYDRVARYGKPVMVAEMGVDLDPRPQLQWLRSAAVAACRLPLLRTLVYFNGSEHAGVWAGGAKPDWRLHAAARNIGQSLRGDLACKGGGGAAD